MFKFYYILFILTIVYIVNPLHCFDFNYDDLNEEDIFFIWNCLTPTTQSTLNRFAKELVNATLENREPSFDLKTVDEAYLARMINKNLIKTDSEQTIPIPSALDLKAKEKDNMLHKKYANGATMEAKDDMILACSLCKNFLNTIFNEKGCNNFEKINFYPINNLLLWRIRNYSIKT